MNIYDVHLLLSSISNQIVDIDRFDKQKDLKLLNDYKHLYRELRKSLIGVDLEVLEKCMKSFFGN